jgi:hypothetical protein
MNFEVVEIDGGDDFLSSAPDSMRTKDLEEPAAAASDPPAMHADDTRHRSHTTEDAPILVLTKRQAYYAWFMSDVLLYVCILNLSSEWVRNIHIERFSISLFVAVVLKLVLNAIQAMEHHIKHLVCDVWNRKLIGAFCMWLVVFSSKFLILWIDDVIFRSQVELGYFWEILILSLVLVLSSIMSRWLFGQLGRWDTQNDPSIPEKQETVGHSNDEG